MDFPVSFIVSSSEHYSFFLFIVKASNQIE